MRTKIRGGLLLFAIGALALVATPAWGQQASVSAVDNEFDPAQLRVDAGTTVTWTNNGESPHTVTGSDGSFESGNLDPGQTFSHTFDEPGEFAYVCDYHEADGMVGSITVAQANEGGGGNGGNGNGGNGNGDATDPTDPDEPATDDGDESLPQTGPDGLGAFVYLAGVLIGAGLICLHLDRRPVVPQTGSATQSRVK